MNKQFPMFLKILVFLNFASIILPVAMQYFVASLLLIWFLFNKLYFKFKPTNHYLYEADGNSYKKLVQVLGIFFAATFLTTITGSFLSIYHINTSKILSEAWHLSAKQTILPFALLCGFNLIKRKYGAIPDFSRSIALYIALYFIYCLFQRYTGIDWVKGFGAILPENRFAYGVYRLSGFMGHPLTLAYNLIFSALLFSFFCYNSYLEGHKSRAFWWASSVLLCVGILLLSGSRWPLIVLFLSGLLWSSRFIFRRWKIAILLGGIFMSILVVEGSLIGRFSEIYSSGRVKTEEIPRLVFWQIHTKMFVDHPMWGVGYSARTLGSVDYYNKNGYNNIERKYSAHNQYLQVLADSGLVGFVVLFGFWSWMLILFKLVTDSTIKKVLFTSVFIVALSCLMKNVLRDSEFLFGLWICLAVCYMNLPFRGDAEG